MRIPVLIFYMVCWLSSYAQTPQAQEVLNSAQRVNNYFMQKYADPTESTHVGGKTRPSNLWTRAVYYEGLTALYDIDPQAVYLDYIDRWAEYHQWTPRNGVKTTDADDQCCAQTYIWRYRMTKSPKMLVPITENIERQMSTDKQDYWWWIDAIQMAMPIYAMMYKTTGNRRYMDYAMSLYNYSRNEIGGGLFNTKDGFWWRDKRFAPPFTESDGKNCYWSRGNGWVYAAIVRCMNELSPNDPYYQQLKKDFLLMSRALLKWQRTDGFWNASIVSTAYAGKELSGTALFLYGMSWGLRQGVLKGKKYRQACDRAWLAIANDCIHPTGFLGYVQGTGSQPADNQPVTYEKAPDFEDYGTGCFLLGATAYCQLLGGAKPQPLWPLARPEAKAGVRWWWMGSAVDEPSLRMNIQDYARAGIGSVEITPIYGVQNNERNELPFLSAPWMRALQVVEDQGKRDGILVDMTTGTGWPFGGPTTPIEEAACKAVFIIDTVAVGQPVKKKLHPHEKEYAHLSVEKRYPLAEGKEQVVQLYVSRTRQTVKRAAPGGEGWVIDHFDRQAVKHYLERFDQAFASTNTPYPHNFFNDSYEVYGANWTPTLFDEFQKRRGYALEEHLRELLGLVDDGNLVLSDYRETLSDMLLENFSQQWTAWAHEHGVQTRNQAHGSPANLIDVYASVDVPEIEGFGLSEFGIKGLRTDSGMTKKNFSDVSMLKYASSAAHITGKPLTSSETFTWLTEHFRTSLSQMKPDLDLMFSCGVNHMFFHGTTYSPKDALWPGWKFYASVDMSPTNSIWRDAPYLMQYIERCQGFLQMGQPDNDFLIYLPVRDMWRQRLMEGEKGLLMQFDIHSMNIKAPDFIHSILKIDSLGYDCDYISDQYLLSTTFVNGRLQTAAGTRYNALIIPGSGQMPNNLKAHLEQLRQKGACIIWGIDAEQMRQSARPEALRTDYGLRVLRRRNATGYHYFIANLTPCDIDAVIPLAIDYATADIANPMTGEITHAQLTDNGIHFSLRSGESRILQTYNSNINVDANIADTLLPLTKDCHHRQQSIRQSLIGLPPQTKDLTRQHWELSFIQSAPQVVRTFQLDQLQTWETLDDDSVRITMGTGCYSTTFRLTAQEAARSWSIELGDVRESARVYINDVYIGCAWAVPFTLDCKTALKAGDNQLRIEVTNLPANRIAHLDRIGYPWRKFKDINIVDLNYKKHTYEKWKPVPSGLNSTVRIVSQ